MKNTREKCKLCISFGSSHLGPLLKQMERAAQWADLMEIRLDRLSDIDLESLYTIKKFAPCPLIWTLRKASQGGDFRGSEEERLQLLRLLLLNIGPDFIDLEADISESELQSLQSLSSKTQWIISWHDFTQTPKDLEALYRKAARLPANYYKIAAFAQNSTDALRMLNFSRKLNRESSHFLGLCMGQFGQPTRILAPVAGQPFTYAALEKGKETAPGQLTGEELISIYNFHRLNEKTQILGLIGRPVDKSLSEITHNAVLRGLNADVYLKFCVEDAEIPEFFNEIQALPVRGLSVTMPFKETVLHFLKKDPQLAACNTLLWTKEEWRGFNTDCIGAIKALGFASLKDQKIVILGAGGTAKAIARAASEQGAQLAILNRTPERAKGIAEPLGAKWGPLSALPNLTQKGYCCLIQATSCGMAPFVEESPVPAEWTAKLSRVLDVISNPLETRLLKEVKKRGGIAISGRELFIYQAVEQFVCWFGEDIDRKGVEALIRSHLPAMQSPLSTPKI